MPSLQAAQAAGDVCAGKVLKVPAAQAVQASEDVAPVAAPYVPGRHAAHTVAAVVAPKKPARQTAQAAAPVRTFEYEPGAHVVHAAEVIDAATLP